VRQRRRHDRFRVHQHVWCSDGTSTLYVRASDASLGGLFLRAPGVEVGRVFRLSFAPDGGEEIVAQVRAVWSGPTARGRLGVGLAILGFTSGAESYEGFVRAAASR